MELSDFQSSAICSGRDYVGDFLDPEMAIAVRVGEEAGEVQGIVKRIGAGSQYTGKKNLAKALEDELGDLLHAAAQLAYMYDLDLEKIAKRSITKQFKKGPGIVPDR